MSTTTQPPKDRDRSQPSNNVHHPADHAFTSFLQGELVENPPQRVEVVPVFGDKANRRGTNVKTFNFAPNKKFKPEETVELANEIRMLAQANCNNRERSTKYAVLVWDNTADAKPRAGWLLSLTAQPIVRSGEEGGAIGDPDDDDEDSDGNHGGPRVFSDRFKVMSKDHRWREQMFATAMGDILEKYQDIVDKLVESNRDLNHERTSLVVEVEKARSEAHVREMDLEWTKLKVEGARDGLRLVKGAVPLAIAKLTGKTPPPNGKTAESMAIEEFLNGLRDDQVPLLFGDTDDHGSVTRAGIFTLPQLKILTGIAKCELPSSALDQLFEGPLAITQQQLTQAQGVLTEGQAMTFGPFLMEQKQKFDERKGGASQAQ